MFASAFRPALAGALLGLTLGAHAAPAAHATVTFDTTPRAGQHQRQQLDIQAVVKMRVEAAPEATEEQRAKIAQAAERMAQMGAMKMSMQTQQTMKVGQPDAEGWLPLTVSTGGKSGKMEVGGKTVPLPGPNQDLSFTARFNPKDFAFEIQQADGAPELSEFMRNQGSAMVGEALQLSKALSQRPFKVGDSVDVPLNMALPVPLPGGAGAMGGKVHYTLARLDHGIAHFDLSMNLDMDIAAPMPAPAASAAAAASAPQDDAASATAATAATAAPAASNAPQTLQVKINGSGKGNSALRLADRLPLANQLKMDMQMTMRMPDNGIMHMDMDMRIQAKGESLAKPAATGAKAPAKKKT